MQRSRMEGRQLDREKGWKRCSQEGKNSRIEAVRKNARVKGRQREIEK